MLDRWVFEVGIAALSVAVLIDIVVLRLQIQTFSYKSQLQPLKRILLAGVASLVVASLPLILVYANILWFKFNAPWIIYIAVLTNAFAKIIVGLMWYLTYKYKVKGDDL